jgi:phosphoglycolate phosphatase
LGAAKLPGRLSGMKKDRLRRIPVSICGMNRLARFVTRRKAPPAPPDGTPPRAVLFDFDGTIGDTFEAGYEILNKLAGEFGFRPLRREDLPRARNMRTRELMAFLGIPTTKLTRISRRGTQELAERIHTIQPLPGTADAIRRLAAHGLTLGIITSNSEANVHAFLANHNLEHFSLVRSSSKLLGKAREIRAALTQFQMHPREVLFVGDETRDIEACKKVGVPIAAATWGYNSRLALEALEPDFMISRPDELFPLLSV